jgi:putative Ca2+/H+ antiporter (TMEM165/GDT1 family)
MAALGLLSVLAVYIGKYLMEKVNGRTISIVAGCWFIIMGIACFF